MERWSHTNAIGSLHGRCRVHRAEILRLRGRCDEAEAEAIRAWEELRPYLKRELGWPLTELGRIRLRKRDLERRGTGTGRGPQRRMGRPTRAGAGPPRARRRDRCGGVDPRRARAPVVGAVEGAAAAHGPAAGARSSTHRSRSPSRPATSRARDAARELTAIARRFRSNPLIAAATLAEGRVRFAEDDLEAAAQRFADAAKRWGDVGAPYEAAIARLRLADAHRARGADDRAVLRGAGGPRGSSTEWRPHRRRIDLCSRATGRAPPDRRSRRVPPRR